MQSIKFKKLNDNAVLPEFKSTSAAGLDLTLSEDITVTGNVSMGKTGLAVEIPEGYFGMLVQRSSLAKVGVMLANSVGIIDSDYRGELMLPLITYKWEDYQDEKDLTQTRPLQITLTKGERVGQLIIVPCSYLSGVSNVQFDIIESDELSDTARGEGGFGSTGKN